MGKGRAAVRCSLGHALLGSHTHHLAATERARAETAENSGDGQKNPKAVLSLDPVRLLSRVAAGMAGEALAGVKWCFMLYLTGAIWPTG